MKIRFRAYQTLYECLEKIAIISAPTASILYGSVV